MRSAPFDLVIYEDENAKPARWGRHSARQAGDVARSDEAAVRPHRSLAWLTGLARRRHAAGGRAAA
jgi:hypothetical protein